MATPDAPRPRTTTRDPELLRARLRTWVSGWRPGATVTELSAPQSNGMSSDTVLFDLLAPDGVTQPCVLRLAADPDAYTVFPAYDMERQYRCMELVAAHTKAPVPRLLRLEPDPGPLGAPGFVMERVDGRVPPDLMPYTYSGNWLHEASGAERAQLQRESVELLAEVHRAPVAEAGFLRSGAAVGASPLRRHVDEARAYYAWVVQGRAASPLIERAFARLERLWPADEGETVLNWGDARIGNVIYQGFSPAAVLDWEMAALGPRELDLGWFVFLHRFFQDLTVAFGQEGLPDFLGRDEVAAQYAEASGHTPHDLEFFTLYAALRHAVVMLRIGYRQVHFGEAEPPADPDALILHRATLEAMVEGRYWPS
ncbi:phosphotransferase family protein [Streptacidiphilus jiangxiensis]|uniref:Predicted kinase, aminoglycoside phosphotransferase (APT) family n=1 Tax=Streptacidiphilus jiangxiensis TaxID=235985 RepID=A0A1H7WSR7_STRJI|nr:phosphotransferase family protein [Streptacidiphilus jiangxiensis]SEM24078.1 Predicted kinase, aminoglycoside phosphotransferase (APT) family [Streptacidiphilus jiangxiensis]